MQKMIKTGFSSETLTLQNDRWLDESLPEAIGGKKQAVDGGDCATLCIRLSVDAQRFGRIGINDSGWWSLRMLR